MDEKKKVLLVEDNPDILWANHAVFKSAGYAVYTAESLSEARRRLSEDIPDAIVLDLILPDGSALDFVSEIRSITDAPILMLTALNDKDDRLAGFRAGGDDYITKPYDMDELVARVDAFLRREKLRAVKPLEKLTCGPITLDTVSNQAYVNGNNLQLAGKEFALLYLFVRNREKTVSKEFIYETIWNLPLAGDDTALKNTVYRLRKKLETSESGYEIFSSRGEGYTFTTG
ncbi:MAG: response regulator transcription factor [Oscillospiraceae bacterium]|jgi:DNA-binding response OmpR family regulator|nr:response regulator transcription factor [Oscillospiraceae bacterium]